MTSPIFRPARGRLVWWAVPGLAVVGTAIGMGVVVGPTLGEQVPIPRQIVLPAMSRTVAASRPVAHRAATPRATHRPTPATTHAPAATPAPIATAAQTHVVAPQRPVVTASADDHTEGSDVHHTPNEGTDR